VAIIQRAAPQATAPAQPASSGAIHPPTRSPHKDRYAEPCDCGVKAARAEENKRLKAQGKRAGYDVDSEIDDCRLGDQPGPDSEDELRNAKLWSTPDQGAYLLSPAA
jgi:hypothetical protein